MVRQVVRCTAWCSCLGYRRAGCLQLSHRRPPEMCVLRTRPQTDVDPPRFLPSARWEAYRLAAPSGQYLVLLWCVLLTDTSVGTLLLNITVHMGNPNTTVVYNLTEPYSGRTVDNRETDLTPEQKVNTAALTLTSQLSFPSISRFFTDSSHWTFICFDIDSPLSSSITPSLFHSRLKTFLLCKSFPP